MDYKLVCKHCLSEDVLQMKWVNPNTNEVSPMLAGTEGLIKWCKNCDSETDLIEPPVNNIRKNKDGFVWMVIPPDKAKYIIGCGLFNLCALYEDDTEVEIETEAQLYGFLESDYEIAIPVGKIL